MAQYSVNWSAKLSSSSGSVSVGLALVKDSSGTYVVGTTANRASYGRCSGVAATAGDAATPVVALIEAGPISDAITGLGAGTASWVRVSSTGTLERCTPSSGDDVVGKCKADGTLHLVPGVFDSSNYTSSSGDPAMGGDVSGTASAAVVAKVNGATVPAAGALTTGNAAYVSGASALTYSALNLAGGAGYVTGTLPVGNGGTGITALGTGVAAWLGATLPTFPASGLIVGTTDTQTLSGKTISGASNTLTVRLASDVSGTLPVANGGTGLTALGTALYVLRVNAGGTALEFAAASGGTTPNGSSGDIMTSNGASDFGTAITPAAGIATWLATPSSANLATAVTDETGSGALVFGTSPTLSNPVVTITSITNATAGGTINDCTLSGTSGATRRVRFTNGSGPTITGFDASGVADGTILRVLAAGAALAFTSEDAGSTAANRITLYGGFTINLSVGTFTQFEYDATASRWRHIGATAI